MDDLARKVALLPELMVLNGDPKDARIRNYGRGYSDAVRDVLRLLGDYTPPPPEPEGGTLYYVTYHRYDTVSVYAEDEDDALARVESGRIDPSAVDEGDLIIDHVEQADV